MNSIPTLVFPGLDGSTGMLESFRSMAPKGFDVSLCPLPPGVSKYGELADHFADQFSTLRHVVLIAESFSGPMAIRLAQRHADVVTHLILVGSFATPPVGRWAVLYLPSLLFRFPMPKWFVRRWMLGPKASVDDVRALQSTVWSANPTTLARRVRTLASIDALSELDQLSCRTMYLRPTEDAMIPARCVDEIERLPSGIEIRRMAGPHLLLETNPQACWSQIEQFVGHSASRESCKSG